MAIFDSAVFAESGNLGNRPLKNKDALREAFIYNELAHMNKKDRAEFRSSPAAKYLLENEIISYETLDRLVASEYGDRATEFFVCHMAKENGDERWDALVKARDEERRLMDELMASYGDKAAAKADSYREDYINHNVPKGLRNE